MDKQNQDKMRQKTNKIAKGLVSFTAVLLLLVSILAGSVFYQSNITGNAIKYDYSPDAQASAFREVGRIKDLNQLNEGWYFIRNGYVYYLEHFDSYVPLYIKVKDPLQQNGILLIDADGNAFFEQKAENLVEIINEKNLADKNNEDDENNFESSGNLISGFATGMEMASGFATSYIQCPKSIKEKNTEDVWFFSGIKDNKCGYTYTGYDYHLNAPTTEPSVKGTISAVYDQSSKKLTITASTGTFNDPASKDSQYGKPGTIYDTAGVLNLNQYEAAFVRYLIEIEKKSPQEAYSILEDKGSIIEYQKKLGVDPIGQIGPQTKAAAEKQLIPPEPPKPANTYSYKIFENGKEIYTQSVPADTEAAAVEQLKKDWGSGYTFEKTSAVSGTAPTSKGIEVIDVGPDKKFGKIFYNGQNLGTYDKSSETFKSLTSEIKNFENLQKNNGGLTALQVWGAFYAGGNLNNEVASALAKIFNFNPQASQQAGQIQKETPQLVRLKDGSGKEIDKWAVPGTGVIIDGQDNFNKYTAEQNFQSALKKISAKIAEFTSSDNKQVAKVGSQYYFYDGKEFIKYTADFKLKGKIGSEENSLPYLQEIDFKTGKTKGYELQQGGRTATVDEQTLNNIGRYLSQGGKFSIVQESGKKSQPPTFEDWCNERESCTEEYPREPDLWKKLYNDDISALTGQNQLIEIRDQTTGLVLFSEKRSADWTSASGTKTTESARIAYFDENGNELTKKEIDKLTKEGKLPSPKRVIASLKDESYVGKEKITTYYTIQLKKTQNSEGKTEITQVMTGMGRDSKGDLKRFVYAEVDSSGQQKTVVLDGEGKVEYESSNVDTNFESKAKSENSKRKSREFFANFERTFTEFRGLGYFATCCLPEDFLLKWRETVDEAFATLYLGSEYWTSSICSRYLSGEQEGIAFAETPEGLAQIGAHVEATRTAPILGENIAEYIYKITFNVKNGEFDKDRRAPEEMRINVVLKGGQMQTIKEQIGPITTEKTVWETSVDLFKNDIAIPRGQSYGKAGKDAVVQDSKVLYSQICIRFDKVPLKWKISNKELCNTIQESTEEPTKLKKSVTPSNSAASPGQQGISDF